MTKTSVAVLSSVLRLGRNGAVALRLRPGSERVKATIVLQTQRGVRLTTRSKARVITLARRSYTIAPGAASRTVTLTLTKDGRTLLRRVASVRVRISVRPAGAKPVSRNATLRR